MNSELNSGFKPTVLIADDDASTRTLLRVTISQWDYPVLEARDGEEAWDILNSEESPQIVTVDWMMPKIDGLSLCRRAKNLKKPPYMILLTNLSGSTNIVSALDAGADDFLSKPFNYAELRSRLYVGQRIINFTTALEEAIKGHKPDAANLNSMELSNVIEKINEISVQMDDQWSTLKPFLTQVQHLDFENAEAMQKVAESIHIRQQQLAQEIKHLSALIENRNPLNPN